HPVLLHTTTGIEFELGLPVTFFVRFAWREDLNDQVGRNYKVASFISAARESFQADPNDIGDYVVILGKDQSGRGDNHAESTLIIPFIEEPEKPSASILVLETWRSGHVKFSFDDFSPLAVIRHKGKVRGSEFCDFFSDNHCNLLSLSNMALSYSS
ncbi:MAG TPA: hypothetical protein VE715_04640, partial [Blastocatellia bacterium]|nr:hypothetical protein [Blastocatellia bacterium]